MPLREHENLLTVRAEDPRFPALPLPRSTVTVVPLLVVASLALAFAVLTGIVLAALSLIAALFALTLRALPARHARKPLEADHLFAAALGLLAHDLAQFLELLL
jgi:hypothetical protein